MNDRTGGEHRAHTLGAPHDPCERELGRQEAAAGGRAHSGTKQPEQPPGPTPTTKQPEQPTAPPPQPTTPLAFGSSRRWASAGAADPAQPPHDKPYTPPRVVTAHHERRAGASAHRGGASGAPGARPTRLPRPQNGPLLEHGPMGAGPLADAPHDRPPQHDPLTQRHQRPRRATSRMVPEPKPQRRTDVRDKTCQARRSESAKTTISPVSITRERLLALSMRLS